jgi:hypothetical protein
MIAELCAKLCAEGKSVLVTALTNRALMEIAEKQAVSGKTPLLLEKGTYIVKTGVNVNKVLVK